MFTALHQGDPRLHDVIEHHRTEQEKAQKMRSALVKRAYRLTRRAGVQVSRAQLEAKTNNQLQIIVQAAGVALHV